MERSEYFNYTRPSQTQLNNTEDSKIRGILRRARSNFQFGTRTGFRITINAANNTQIDIGAGDGFTGGFYKSENLRGSPNSGERISTLTDAATGEAGYTKSVEGLGLVDYSANTLNYVCLKYRETEGTSLAERYYPFTIHNTIVSETYLAEVYTEAQWNALTTAALELRILVGIVTAQGAGNPISLANIQQMVQPKDHPIAGTQPSNITGVTITGVSDETLIGNGTLRFETATKKLYWTAPGDAEGAGVVIGSSGISTLYSDDTSYWIFVDVIFAGLPAADSTDTIRIESLYGRTIPMACAVDQAHRDMTGTGVLSPTNAHAMSIDDITGGTFEHGELYHVNGISGDAEDDQLEPSINAATDSIEIVNNGSARNSFLIDGISYDLLTGYAAGTPGALSFDVLPALDSGDYLIYIDSKGEPQYVKIAEYAPGGPGDTQVLFSANIAIWDIHNETAGQGFLDWDAPNERLRWRSPADAGYGPSVYIMPYGGGANPYGFYKLYSQNLTDWIIVLCNGAALGVSATSNFNIDKNETEHPDDSILKIGIVTWNQLGEIHASLRDIRRFNTADNREEVEEEHDEVGHHTKVFRNALRARASVGAIHGRCSASIGVFGEAFAGDMGVFGSASGDQGVRGIADTDYGGYFYAVDTYGVFGSAGDEIGVAGIAVNATGVYGSAPITGVYGVAGVTGVYGVAANAAGPGVEGFAPNRGVSGEAGVDRGVMGSAQNDYGVYGHADHDVGVFGTALNAYGVRGEAAGDYGVYGSAGNDYGVYGLAAAATGVYGIAPNYGVCGSAVGNYGGYFTADAAAATGLVGLAGGVAATGVYGSGGPSGAGIGGFFTGYYGGVHAEQGGAAGVAIYGSAFNDAATALHLDVGLLRYDLAQVAGKVQLDEYVQVQMGGFAGGARYLRLHEDP